jgi:lysophospholipase L1-like esterase
MGYRGDEVIVPKPEGIFRIVALGSSTTYGNGVTAEEAYPAQLENILRDTYGYTNVEVVNAGVGGYTTWEDLVNLQFRVLDLQPDLVIFYEATNDITLRLIDPRYYNGLNMIRGIWHTEAKPLPSSTLYRFLAINLGWMQDPSALEERMRPTVEIKTCIYDQAFCKDFNMTKRELFHLNQPIYYERNVRNIVAVARMNGIQIMFSSWAYFPDPLPNNVAHYMTQPERQEAVAEHNTLLQRIAEELEVPFYDLGANIPYNPDFWTDGRHLTPLGTHEQAFEYAVFLVENQLLPPN